MIFLFDTSVFREKAKRSPNPSVAAFLRAVPVENIRLSTVVLAEIAQGVENNPTPILKTFLADVLALPLAEFGKIEALEWGRITSAALKRGVSIDFRESFIAAIASTRGWTVATRNTSDFAPLGVQVFNPWNQKL
ncbi:MAG TPA: PIN domain-containing protein [Verrucomicrobiae bacterium]|nr:PIN domain-containing protein [Verrucomicrobiae bacterium]